ncbi:NAD-dependent epimerase/dehydratase family protein [Winogradskyella sp. UBA3174]|uniref:NAD-dependent epimerase/dehydratase family protein n=1 Tax=Winogradskyella sp. UBA3174 TaxID=1947785 RepID=UPI0025FEFD30|nr:NAD-dependent epimerase/dehydratase family protein [Winogradskyella sp. UBA3174]|tara:strand:- start:11128 stop:12069 length:942 start_codon:yes stop_codon:yes gene_type:complete
MKTVGIIGGSGFIGSHTTKQFLEQGYKVKVSATDISKPEKYQHLKQLPNADHLEIVPLKVENKAQLQNFINGCDVVVHGGTPFKLDFEDAKAELFDPTIKGTENFLEIVNKAPQVKRVIFIASVAAYNTNFPMPAGNKNPNETVNENDTPYTSKESHPYAQAKFIANQTVSKFIEDNPNVGFEISSVSPTFVIGKQLSKREDSTSSGMQFLFKNKIAPNPFMQMMYDNDVEFAMVDVKDVANAIYKLTTKTGLHGKNYLLSSESWKISDISAMLNNEAPKGNGRVIYQNDAAKQDLNIEFSPALVALKAFNSK